MSNFCCHHGRAGESPNRIRAYTDGYFVGPTVVYGLSTASVVAETEIFGPMLNITHVLNLEEATEVIGGNSYGNASSVFTTHGATACKFRNEVPTGNMGVNIAVAAPMAYFPFNGWKRSFFEILYAQGRDAVAFYRAEKVVIERWPKKWRRRF